MPTTCDPFNFGPAVNYWVEPRSDGVSTGDFNGDGNLDIVRAGTVWSDNMDQPNRLSPRCRYYRAMERVVSAFRPQTRPSGGIADSMAVGEFNGDGRHDVAVFWYSYEESRAGVWIAFGDEAGRLNFAGVLHMKFTTITIHTRL